MVQKTMRKIDVVSQSDLQREKIKKLESQLKIMTQKYEGMKQRHEELGKRHSQLSNQLLEYKGLGDRYTILQQTVNRIYKALKDFLNEWEECGTDAGFEMADQARMILEEREKS